MKSHISKRRFDHDWIVASKAELDFLPAPWAQPDEIRSASSGIVPCNDFKSHIAKAGSSDVLIVFRGGDVLRLKGVEFNMIGITDLDTH